MNEYNKMNFTEPIFQELQRMRETSIKQFHKTDIYQGKPIDSVLHWYDQIFSIIRDHPPDKQVHTVEIFEKDCKIVKVEYKYDEMKPAQKPSFRFIVIMPS